MSLISNIHTAIVYENKGVNKTVAQFGQRLVVTKAKADAKGNYGPNLQQTMATSIPNLNRNDIDFSLASIQDACIDYFKSVQNSMVTERIKEGKKEVTSAEINSIAIIEYLNDSNSSGEKWDSAKIVEWFTENLAEHIGVALLTKGMNEDKIELSLNAYAKLLGDNLGSKTVISAKKAEAIQKALNLGNQEDSVIIKFQTRISKSLKVENLDEVLGL